MEMSGQLHVPAILPLGTTPVPIEWETEWIRGLVWTFRRTLISSLHNNYAIAARQSRHHHY